MGDVALKLDGSEQSGWRKGMYENGKWRKGISGGAEIREHHQRS